MAARSQKVGKCGMFYTDKRRVSPPQGIVRLAQAVKVLVDLKETVKPNWKKRAWYRDRRARQSRGPCPRNQISSSRPAKS